MSDRSPRTPNIVIVFGDQWRAQAAGYAGNAVVRTPHLDRLADESVHFVNAVAGCPVCSPYRASLLTGQQ
ncbi:MAG TPA: sulfatase-like hydrolase/transferase, partial [Phycisphaerae bacterium]|nr:sulfatase-like hydrolase/transferase [Phycisphaerae bacterium]